MIKPARKPRPSLLALKRHKTRFRPEAYPRKVRDKIQDDYSWKLSRQEQEWLASFNEAQYGGNPDCLENITGQPITVEERRRLWREAKRYESDTASLLCRLDVRIYYIDANSKIQSNESSLVEMIDSIGKLEREIVENLKFMVTTKEWECLEAEV